MGVPTLIMQTLASPPAGSADASAALVRASPSGTGDTVALLGSNSPKIILSQVINQAKDIEIQLLEADVINEHRKNYSITFGDSPMENSEVTDAQLSALQYLINSGLPPYVDFGIWGPYGVRVERRMKFTSHVLDAASKWT